MNIDLGSIILDFPNMDVVPSYIEALREGYKTGIQPAMSAEEIKEIEENSKTHVENLNEKKTGVFTAPDGSVFPYVPYEHLWLTQNDFFIGSVSFRHELNEFFTGFAGHIGYGIRPSFQGKGAGTLALKLLRRRAAERGIERLLVTCSPDNPASEKVILNNGGELWDISSRTYGFEQVKRYWVPTDTDRDGAEKTLASSRLNG
ncbi:MAG: GNAT family N-acetyltransferase [Alphaproteobacteria bacterium]|nr:GNAT family N-acetyltransferase [Alphaproteobacteria bacterium]